MSAAVCWCVASYAFCYDVACLLACLLACIECWFTWRILTHSATAVTWIAGWLYGSTQLAQHWYSVLCPELRFCVTAFFLIFCVILCECIFCLLLFDNLLLPLLLLYTSNASNGSCTSNGSWIEAVQKCVWEFCLHWSGFFLFWNRKNPCFSLWWELHARGELAWSSWSCYGLLIGSCQLVFLNPGFFLF